MGCGEPKNTCKQRRDAFAFGFFEELGRIAAQKVSIGGESAEGVVDELSQIMGHYREAERTFFPPGPLEEEGKRIVNNLTGDYDVEDDDGEV